MSAPFPSSFRSSFSCSSFFSSTPFAFVPFISQCSSFCGSSVPLGLLPFHLFRRLTRPTAVPKEIFNDFHVRYTLYIVSTRPRPCPKLKRRNNPGPLHVGYRIRALYLREQDTCQLAPASYVVVCFSPCTCFRVHLPSLLCYSIPCSFFLFVSCFFSSLSYSTSLSPLCPSLAKVNGQWHGGKMGTPACDADYTHYITSLPLSPHFNRCNFLLNFVISFLFPFALLVPIASYLFFSAVLFPFLVLLSLPLCPRPLHFPCSCSYSFESVLGPRLHQKE